MATLTAVILLSVFALAANAVEKVQVGFYSEALCPGCDQLAETTMNQAVREIGEIFDLDFVPWGNARLVKPGKHAQFECQHGPTECIMNTIEACILHYNKERSVWWPYVVCTEAHGYEQTINTAKECAAKNNISWTEVYECHGNELGVKLELEAYNKTASLNPPHTYTPWVTVNGKHLENTNDLITTICSEYKGSDKPSACSQFRAVDKTINPVCRRQLIGV